MSSPEPVASVIVPTHRGVHRLPALLDALAAQDTPDRWEVLVVLDGAPDGSRQVLEKYRNRLDLRVLESPAPHGVVAALNTGYAAARGGVLIRCDDDLTPGPAMVRRHVAHHAGRDDLGISCAMRDLPGRTAYSRAYGQGANRLRVAQWYSRPAALRWVDWSAHNSLSRSAWERLDHGFDPRFVYGQDSELGYRLTCAGVSIDVDPELEIEHRGVALSAANRVPRGFVTGASRRLFEQLHGTSHDLADLGPGTSRARTWRVATRLPSLVVRSWVGYRRIGRLVEAVLPLLPRRVGGRLVAFAVESAAVAGRRHGPEDLTTLGSQKRHELDREHP